MHSPVLRNYISLVLWRLAGIVSFNSKALPAFDHPNPVMADHLHKIAAEIVQLYHRQLSLLVLCNIAGLKVADLIDYERGKGRIQELQKELQSMRAIAS